jgi:hypothetical protein
MMNIDLPGSDTGKTQETRWNAASYHEAIRNQGLFMYTPTPPMTHRLAGHKLSVFVAELLIR